MPSWNWITDQIAIGSAPLPSEVHTMQLQSITDVLDLRGEPRAGENGPQPDMYRNSGIDYHYVGMLDRGIVASTTAQANNEYLQGIAIINAALAKPNGKILVHCAAGQSRSPSMVYAYLLSIGYSPADAWNQISTHRGVASQQYFAFAARAVNSGGTPTPTPTTPDSTYIAKTDNTGNGIVTAGASTVGPVLILAGISAFALWYWLHRSKSRK